MKLKIVKTKEELDGCCQVLLNAPEICWDTETTGLDWWRSNIFLHSFCIGEDTFLVFTRDFAPEVLTKFLKIVFADINKLIIGQNLKFDRHHLKKTHGVDIYCRMEDTMIQSFLLDENKPTGLKARLRSELGFDTDEETAVKDYLKEHFSKQADYRYDTIPDHIIAPYAGMDTWGCYKLYKHNKPQIDKDFKDLFAREMKVFDILFKMEQNGVPLDIPYLKKMEISLLDRIENNQTKLFAEAGSKFDVDSNVELAEMLYKKLGIAVPRVTGKGADSTDDEALSMIDHPVAELIRYHRSLSHTLNNYVVGLQNRADEKGVVHGDYSLTRTKTGRFSCSNPNLQNMAKNDELRKAFIVDNGEEMVFWDQSQIEMVGFAMYSKDPKMCAALKANVDLHLMTASEVLTKPKEDIDDIERGMGKGTNFAMVYCVGKAKLARYLSGYAGRRVTDDEALQFKQKYLQAFPDAYAFQRLVIDTVKSFRQPYGNYVKNKFGRVRRCPDTQKAYALVNHLIQGWAADLMKESMVRIEEKYHPKWRQNIHDAIRLDVPREAQEDFIRGVAECLTNWPDVGLPIKCTVDRSSTSWDQVKRFKL